MTPNRIQNSPLSSGPLPAKPLLAMIVFLVLLIIASVYMAFFRSKASEFWARQVPDKSLVRLNDKVVSELTRLNYVTRNKELRRKFSKRVRNLVRTKQAPRDVFRFFQDSLDILFWNNENRQKLPPYVTSNSHDLFFTVFAPVLILEAESIASLSDTELLQRLTWARCSIQNRYSFAKTLELVNFADAVILLTGQDDNIDEILHRNIEILLDRSEKTSDRCQRPQDGAR